MACATTLLGGIVGTLWGMNKAMGDQKSIGTDAQGGMVMEAAPVAAFVRRQAELLFEFPAVALDAPTHLGDQRFQLGLAGRRRQPVVGRFRASGGPFEQQPLSGRTPVAR